MGTVIGSARYDERGKISGGVAGDQTGKEVSTQNYYVHSKGWYLLRPKSKNLAIGLSAAMKQACSNNNVGYDQNNRLDIITNIKIFKNIKDISVPTECDCSSLIRACCIQNGFDPGNFTTANEVDMLERTGKFEQRVVVGTKTTLLAGDILVTITKGHTAMVVDSTASPSTNVNKPKESKNYIVGNTYTLNADMYVRDFKGKHKKWNEITSDGQKHGYKDASGNALLKSGTRVTCKSVLNRDGGTWLECPSGYICAIGSDGRIYVK